jgi:hypothetical protein
MRRKLHASNNGKVWILVHSYFEIVE